MHLEDVDALLCDGGSLLAEEAVYLLQMKVDGVVIVLICREWLRWRETQEDGHSIVHDGLYRGR